MGRRTLARASNPLLWPSAFSMRRLRAKRRLPSIMNAMCCGTGPCRMAPMSNSRSWRKAHSIGGDCRSHRRNRKGCNADITALFTACWQQPLEDYSPEAWSCIGRCQLAAVTVTTGLLNACRGRQNASASNLHLRPNSASCQISWHRSLSPASGGRQKWDVDVMIAPNNRLLVNDSTRAE